MSSSDAPSKPLAAQVLWGRVATAVVVVLMAFGLGRCTAPGVPRSEVTALEAQVDDLQSANDRLQQQVASDDEPTTTEPGTTATASPTGDPDPSTAPAEGTPGGIHTVAPGDTLHAIAIEVYGDREKAQLIADANNLEPGATLQVGQVLQLPPAQ